MNSKYLKKGKNLRDPYKNDKFWSARGVMAIVVGDGHGYTSSNPGRDW